MATHSSVLAWRIPGTREPGGLPSVGSHRVGHDWSDLAAAVAGVQTSDGERICSQCKMPGFDPWVGKIPWRREWLLTPVFLPRESHEQRSLVGYYYPWDCKESDMTEQPTLWGVQTHPYTSYGGNEVIIVKHNSIFTFNWSNIVLLKDWGQMLCKPIGNNPPQIVKQKESGLKQFRAAVCSWGWFLPYEFRAVSQESHCRTTLCVQVPRSICGCHRGMWFFIITWLVWENVPGACLHVYAEPSCPGGWS